MIKTNWCVITGGPSSGKTTTVNILKNRGFKTTIEHARHYIDTQRVQGKTVTQIRENQLEFQHRVLDMQIAQEESLPPKELVFLDRAIPDALAYYRFLNLPIDGKLKEALGKFEYRRVFILEPLPLVKDYARTEDQLAQKEIWTLITEAYESLSYAVIEIPVLCPERRVDLILNIARRKAEFLI